jgi:Uma2 family endonuclease
MNLSTLSSPRIIYPESDGKPMADNGKQFRWIVVLFGNLAALYRDKDHVFVGGNQLWYPVEGHPEVATAPDVYVVFGRPKGDRPSYKQWEEDNIPMTVVFEILSPGNTGLEMIDKQTFYEDHGVEEYYIYDPDSNRLHIFLRKGEIFVRQRKVNEFVSPRLGIRFTLSGEEMVVYRPDGRPFLAFEEIEAAEQKARQEAEKSRQEAEQARQEAEKSQRFAARLAELTRKVRRQEATEADLAELDRLIEESSGRDWTR